MIHRALRRTTLGATILLGMSVAACSDDPAEPDADPQFSGSYSGVYSGSGGCDSEAVSGDIAFTIDQDGTTLDVAYTVSPTIEGLGIFGGQAEIASQTARSFTGTITEPAVVTGEFTGTLSNDESSISGDVGGSATVLCNGAPTTVTFEAEYQGTRMD